MAIPLYNLEGDIIGEIEPGQVIPSGRWTTPTGGRMWQMGRGPDQGGTIAGGYTPPPAPKPAAPPPPPPPPVPVPAAPVGKPQPLTPAQESAAELARLGNAAAEVSARRAANAPINPAPSVSPLFDPTHRVVGTDADGNTIYRLTDEAGMVIQWTEIDGVALNFQNLGPAGTVPAYVSPTPPPAAPTPAPAPIVPPAPVSDGVSPLFDPTHRQVGTDALGNPVFRLIDEAGTVIQWAVIDGIATNYANLGPAATAPAYVSPQPVSTLPAPQAPAPVSQPPAVSPLFDPTHRLVGRDAQGNPVYRLVDEAGNVIQWREVAGAATGLQNLGPAGSVPAYVSPAASAQPGASTGGSGFPRGGGLLSFLNPSGSGSPAGGSAAPGTSTILLIGAGIAAAAILSRKR